MMIRTHISAALAAIAGLSATAVFADYDVIPAGCSPILTVQTATCMVSTNWTCGNDQPWGVASFDADGLLSIVRHTAQGAPIDAEYTWDNSYDLVVGEPKDPYALAMMMLNGRESYDLQISHTDETGTRSQSLTGTDIFTGETLEISGHILREIETNVEYLEADGTLNYRATGTLHMLQDPLVLLNGRGVATDSAMKSDEPSPPPRPESKPISSAELMRTEPVARQQMAVMETAAPTIKPVTQQHQTLAQAQTLEAKAPRPRARQVIDASKLQGDFNVKITDNVGTPLRATASPQGRFKPQEGALQSRAGSIVAGGEVVAQAGTSRTSGVAEAAASVASGGSLQGSSRGTYAAV